MPVMSDFSAVRNRKPLSNQSNKDLTTIMTRNSALPNPLRTSSSWKDFIFWRRRGCRHFQGSLRQHETDTPSEDPVWPPIQLAFLLHVPSNGPEVPRLKVAYEQPQSRRFRAANVDSKSSSWHGVYPSFPATTRSRIALIELSTARDAIFFSLIRASASSSSVASGWSI
jgi:hypothetical protein